MRAVAVFQRDERASCFFQFVHSGIQQDEWMAPLKDGGSGHLFFS